MGTDHSVPRRQNLARENTQPAAPVDRAVCPHVFALSTQLRFDSATSQNAVLSRPASQYTDPVTRSSFFLTLLLAAPAFSQTANPFALSFVPGSSVKLYQVNGDCDWVAWDATITNPKPSCVPTASKTLTNADVLGDDVPVAFEHNGELIVTFGDTIGALGNAAWSDVRRILAQLEAPTIHIAHSTTAPTPPTDCSLNFFPER